MSYRPERLAEEIKKEISDIIKNEVKDPGIGFTTITSVELSHDLRHARVYASVLGDAVQHKASGDALQRATGYIRLELGRRIRLRYIPEITFKIDSSIERGTKIIRLIKEVQGGGESPHE